MASRMENVANAILLTLVLEGLLFGATIAERVAPDFVEPRSGLIGLADVGFNLVQGIWGVISFFYSLVTFFIPNSPWWFGVPMTAYNTIGLIRGIALLFRGGGNDSG